MLAHWFTISGSAPAKFLLVPEQDGDRNTIVHIGKVTESSGILSIVQSRKREGFQDLHESASRDLIYYSFSDCISYNTRQGFASHLHLQYVASAGKHGLKNFVSPYQRVQYGQSLQFPFVTGVSSIYRNTIHAVPFSAVGICPGSQKNGYSIYHLHNRTFAFGNSSVYIYG